jgi:hypothetical protein
MSVVAIDRASGCLVIRWPSGIPDPVAEAPPLGGKTRDGRDAWAEVASGGANLIRSGLRDWKNQSWRVGAPASGSSIDRR